MESSKNFFGNIDKEKTKKVAKTVGAAALVLSTSSILHNPPKHNRSGERDLNPVHAPVPKQEHLAKLQTANPHLFVETHRKLHLAKVPSQRLPEIKPDTVFVSQNKDTIKNVQPRVVEKKRIEKQTRLTRGKRFNLFVDPVISHMSDRHKNKHAIKVSNRFFEKATKGIDENSEEWVFIETHSAKEFLDMSYDSLVEKYPNFAHLPKLHKKMKHFEFADKNGGPGAFRNDGPQTLTIKDYLMREGAGWAMMKALHKRVILDELENNSKSNYAGNQKEQTDTIQYANAESIQDSVANLDSTNVVLNTEQVDTTVKSDTAMNPRVRNITQDNNPVFAQPKNKIVDTSSVKKTIQNINSEKSTDNSLSNKTKPEAVHNKKSPAKKPTQRVGVVPGVENEPLDTKHELPIPKTEPLVQSNETDEQAKILKEKKMQQFELIKQLIAANERKAKIARQLALLIQVRDKKLSLRTMDEAMQRVVFDKKNEFEISADSKLGELKTIEANIDMREMSKNSQNIDMRNFEFKEKTESENGFFEELSNRVKNLRKSFSKLFRSRNDFEGKA